MARGAFLDWKQGTVKAVLKALDEVEEAIKEGSVAGAQKNGEAVMTASKLLVPFKEGVLESTGRVDELVVDATSVTVPLSYGTVYAGVQHDNVDFEHPGGRVDHYLEQPLMSEGAEHLADDVADEVQKRLKVLNR